MKTTPESSAEVSRDKVCSKFSVAFLVLVIVLNGLALYMAWQDQSWGALWIAIIGGPIGNGVLVLSGLAAIPFLKRSCSSDALGLHISLSLGAPITFAVIDVIAIFMMRPHGC